MKGTFWEYTDATTFLESLIDMSVHLLLVDKRQGLVGDSFALGLLYCLAETGSTFSILTSKLLLDPQLCIGNYLNNLSHGEIQVFGQHDLRFW